MFDEGYYIFITNIYNEVNEHLSLTMLLKDEECF